MEIYGDYEGKFFSKSIGFEKVKSDSKSYLFSYNIVKKSWNLRKFNRYFAPKKLPEIFSQNL